LFGNFKPQIQSTQRKIELEVPGVFEFFEPPNSLDTEEERTRLMYEIFSPQIQSTQRKIELGVWEQKF
jgi:hypothetical protein